MSRNVRSEKAKQGRWGGRVLLILVGSLLLAALVWIGVELYGRAISPDLPPVQTETNPQPQ